MSILSRILKLREQSTVLDRSREAPVLDLRIDISLLKVMEANDGYLLQVPERRMLSRSNRWVPAGVDDKIGYLDRYIDLGLVGKIGSVAGTLFSEDYPQGTLYQLTPKGYDLIKGYERLMPAIKEIYEKRACHLSQQREYTRR